jgi:hypothetical protein
MASQNPCCCPDLGDFAVVGMGDPEGLDERIFATLDRVQEHGGGQWWLYAAKCNTCGVNWMIAQDERIHDNFYFKRLDAKAMEEVVELSRWPDDFLRYEQILRLGRQSGKTAHFFDSQSPALVQTVDDLRRERPEISLEDIAYALDISVESTVKLIRE